MVLPTLALLVVDFTVLMNTNSPFRIDENAEWLVLWGTSELNLDQVVQGVAAATWLKARGEQDFRMQNEVTLNAPVGREIGDRLLVVVSRGELGSPNRSVINVLIDLDSLLSAAG